MFADFSVVAIVAAFNEADVIGPVVGDLIAQGIQVYFLDDGSTDDTRAVVEQFLGRGVLAIERLRELGNQSSDRFDWEYVLRRKMQLAQELDATWIIHHDADEFRESPWPHLSLKEAIRAVDTLGFNAIDFLSLDFWPDHDHFRPPGDVRDAFSFYTDAAPYDRLQIRCWKKTCEPVDLLSSGGHEARFAGRTVCPLRFILRHYPIRGQAHGERKVFCERRSRLRGEERARGWHVQYDAFHEGASFIRDRSTLKRYDSDTIRVSLMLQHREVEALKASLDEAVQTADARRLNIESLQHDLQAVQQDRLTQMQALELCGDALARTRQEFDDARAEIASLRAAAEQQVRRIDELERAREALERARVEGQRQLDDVHRSLSWRWTSPARTALRLIRGR
jgi:hypothetical protein